MHGDCLMLRFLRYQIIKLITIYLHGDTIFTHPVFISLTHSVRPHAAHSHTPTPTSRFTHTKSRIHSSIWSHTRSHSDWHTAIWYLIHTRTHNSQTIYVYYTALFKHYILYIYSNVTYAHTHYIQ